MELYNLEEDLSETSDIAGQNPGVVARMEQIMTEARGQHPLFPGSGVIQKGKAKDLYSPETD